LPVRTVQSNASENQQLLLHQHAGETRACWLSVIHRCDVTDGYLRVAPVISDEPQQMLQAAPGRGSDGVTGRVLGRDASDKHHSNWQLAAACLAAETDMLPHTDIDTDLSGVKWRDIGRSLHGPSPLSLHRLAISRCEGDNLTR